MKKGGARLERDPHVGTCNRCGKDWSEKGAADSRLSAPLRPDDHAALTKLRTLLAGFQTQADAAGLNYFLLAHDPTRAGVGAEVSAASAPDSDVRKHQALHRELGEARGTNAVEWNPADYAALAEKRAAFEKPANLVTALTKVMAPPLSLAAGYVGTRKLYPRLITNNGDAKYAIPGVLAGVLATYAGRLLTEQAVNNSLRKDAPAHDRDIERLRATNKLPAEMPIRYDPNYVGNAHFEEPLHPWFQDKPVADHGEIVIGKGLKRRGVVAHEMGHASIHHNGGWLSRFNQSYLRPLTPGPAYVAGGLAPIAGLAMGPVAGAAVGGLAGALANAPTLINEYQASSRAVDSLRRAGYKQPTIDRALSALRPAWGSYLAGAVLPPMLIGAGAGLSKMLLQKSSAADPVVTRLLEAKAHSDAGNYEQKTQIVRELIAQDPGAWRVDSRLNRFVGLTHKSGFKLHLPADRVADLFPPTAIAGYPQPQP
jgi:hypothetical protein